ncbi:carboxymuconolactone decarboxylase family protein [Actinoplanes philippinensis]|uniref:carboxymuconolactone decarboxylase family protein n=1 Tax=Actinoplanes philippinensis TaxID=35752 RepID=UPI0033D58AD3
MTLLQTPETSPLYDADRERMGYVANYSRVFALAPDVQAGWAGLSKSLRSAMDPRRYQLVTLAAARRIGSRYCSFAFATALRETFLDDAGLLDAVTGRSRLAAVDVAVMEFAEIVAGDPAAVTPGDVDRLREHGLSETDIFHVIAAVAARRFFTTVLAATGTTPDDVYDALDPELRKALP